jgi:hypothetical protein
MNYININFIQLAICVFAKKKEYVSCLYIEEPRHSIRNF